MPAGASRSLATLPQTGLSTTNAYGPTEATVNVTHAICQPIDGLITIGAIDANQHAYIVDSQLRLVPMGVPGELLLSGPRLALGYVGYAVWPRALQLALTCACCRMTCACWSNASLSNQAHSTLMPHSAGAPT